MARLSEQEPGLRPEEERVLILAPTGRDSAMTCDILKSRHVECRACNSVQEICLMMNEGAGALIVTDEALTGEAVRCLLETLDEQEPWSDMPIIVFPANGQNANILL